jgi:hypothetical protein
MEALPNFGLPATVEFSMAAETWFPEAGQRAE